MLRSTFFMNENSIVKFAVIISKNDELIHVRNSNVLQFGSINNIHIHSLIPKDLSHSQP